MKKLFLDILKEMWMAIVIILLAVGKLFPIIIKEICSVGKFLLVAVFNDSHKSLKEKDEESSID